jgi:curved DNA-binding protein CbpA
VRPTPPAPRSLPPSSPSARLPAPPTPRGLNPEDEARWNELAELYDRLDDLTHYQLLSVASSAGVQQISAAYYALVKRFHPDRLPTPLAPLSRCAQVLFEQLTEANEVLSSAEQRAAYDEGVAAGGGTRASERMMRNVLESAVDFQKAEVLVKTRDYPRAMQHLQSALNKNPDEPDYLALYAWLLHLQNPGEGAPTDEMLRALNRALGNNPRHERAHYYLGVVLKRLQRDAAALKHFRSAVELNPYNVDAARELRIANMRRGSKPPSQPPPSGTPASGPPRRILSKLFGK